MWMNSLIWLDLISSFVMKNDWFEYMPWMIQLNWNGMSVSLLHVVIHIFVNLILFCWHFVNVLRTSFEFEYESNKEISNNFHQQSNDALGQWTGNWLFSTCQAADISCRTNFRGQLLKDQLPVHPLTMQSSASCFKLQSSSVHLHNRAFQLRESVFNCTSIVILIAFSAYGASSLISTLLIGKA